MTRFNPENPARHLQAGDRVCCTPRARWRRPALAAVALSLLTIGGCASDDTTRSGLFEPYRIDLPQGNYLTRDLLEQVQPGMREEQVRRILGTPLLNNVFRPRQHNYVFSFKHPSGRVDLRQVRILYDEAGLVAAIESDDLPQSESPSDPALPGFRKEAYDRKQPTLNRDSTIMIKIAIAGAGGRMGRTLIEAVLAAPRCELTGALDVAGAPLLGTDAGMSLGVQTGVNITSDPDQALAGADVLIDFTRPEGTLVHLGHCQQLGVAMVIGTTGFDDDGKAAIGEAARKIPIVFAPNMSVGVNVTFKLIEMAARILNEGYDVEVIEAHHRHKVDAPSGTALGMGEIIATAQGKDLKKDGVFAREGVTGERPEGSIGFATIRGGDIVGDHTVLFAGIGERIEITHRSASRMTYAQGSLRACDFISQLPADARHGLFDMQDVLGLKDR